jgi:hypothetical protein
VRLTKPMEIKVARELATSEHIKAYRGRKQILFLLIDIRRKRSGRDGIYIESLSPSLRASCMYAYKVQVWSITFSYRGREPRSKANATQCL